MHPLHSFPDCRLQKQWKTLQNLPMKECSLAPGCHNTAHCWYCEHQQTASASHDPPSRHTMVKNISDTHLITTKELVWTNSLTALEPIHCVAHGLRFNRLLPEGKWRSKHSRADRLKWKRSGSRLLHVSTKLKLNLLQRQRRSILACLQITEQSNRNRFRSRLRSSHRLYRRGHS